MTKPDYRGARGANTGDDFHELWVLHQALALLNQDTDLMAITVEGLRAEDESGTPQDTWDGVDCAFYYGAGEASTASRIIIDQLKYSAANPDLAWTIARLTSTTNKKQDNSILKKLAKAFQGLRAKRPDLAASGNLVVRLVSNQPVDPNVIDALTNQSSHSALQSASGLSYDDFEAFTESLDLSEFGQGSRFALEERLLITISEWTDGDSRSIINDLMWHVRRAMMPESKGEYITRQSILSWMGVSDPAALFPCPSAIPEVERLIPRTESQAIFEQILNGTQRICLHGEGGCGKTTALQEIESLLPQGSAMIKFDCYGGGHYLDSDAYRHRPQDAFLQLSNDLARQLRIPMLVSRAADLDYPRVFKKRLIRAAEVVRARDQNALLLMVIDAADNSIIAANSRSLQEKSFIHEFMTIGELPSNVCFILTARSGRLSSLNLPREFTSLKIAGFSRNETAAHVRGYWNNAPDAWIDDFHDLTGGNPRVQQYALNSTGETPERVLEYLRPTGKDLDQIFRERLDHTRHKVGDDQEIKIFCSGIIALPRPIPLVDLSAVTGLGEDHIRDLCSDLAPGIRHKAGLISLADEDFENFLRAEAEDQLDRIQQAIAERFLKQHEFNPYAAAHVATALLRANQRQEIIDLLKSEREPLAIQDPVSRREVQLQRLQIAMKVCRDTGNNVDAIMTLLIGAEALKTSSVIRRILTDNPDLAASFAQESARRIILRDPREIEKHGPLLLHLMAVDSQREDGVSVRESYRQVQAWLQARHEFFKEHRRKHPDSAPPGWDINFGDIAAETEAFLRITDPKSAVAMLRRWHPKWLGLKVALLLCSKLIISGEASFVERVLVEANIPKPWDLFILVQLALAGREVDLSRIEASLAVLTRRGLIQLDAVNSAAQREFIDEYLDVILIACEIFIARGGNSLRVTRVLEHFSNEKYRHQDYLSTSYVPHIDLTLRAYALLERLAGRKITLESFLITPPNPPDATPSKRLVEMQQKADELQRFIKPLLDIYDICAQLLTGHITAEDFISDLQSATRQYKKDQRQGWQRSEEYIRVQVAFSLSRLTMIPELNELVLLECANSIMDRVPDVGYKKCQVLARFAQVRTTHQQILTIANERASAVKGMRVSAEDKIATLISLARLLLPISYDDAGSFFNNAIDVSGDVDAEAEHEIAMFAPLIDRAVESIGTDKRREIAGNLAMIISDASIRLGGLNQTTWSNAGQTLATVDLSFALAATARWEDMNIVKRGLLLPSILRTALANNSLTPSQASALSPLLDQFDEDLIIQVVDIAVNQREHINREALSEQLAREELLRFGRGTRQPVSKKLSSLIPRDSSCFWQELLEKTTTFHQDASSKLTNPANEFGDWAHKGKEKKNGQDPLTEFDWSGHRFISPEEIDAVISQLVASREVTGVYFSTSSIFNRMETVIRISDRVSHLNALANLNTSQFPEYELADAIAQRVENWYSSPSVHQWCREKLLDVISNLLPGFSRYLSIARSPLPSLLGRSGAPDDKICSALLASVGRHVDKLAASTVYALVGLIAQYCTPFDVAQVVEQYSSRLVHRLPQTDRETWDLDDIPINQTEGVARFVYAFLGDIDLRIRWRASYAVRNLARLGENDVLFRLIELYQNKQERSFRDPDTPFYWLASRLWLMIALDRIATETPKALEDYGVWILERAVDKDFPHVLFRSFAKSTVSTLIEGGYIKIDATQQNLFNLTNTSLTRQKRVRHSHQGGFNKLNYQRSKNRRFQFDYMDTLPYWYDPALRVFSDVDEEEFLDIAEHWIVDHWELDRAPWNWEEEPRKNRLHDDPYLPIDNRHGNLPTLERYSTHLEWHAMWCTVGQLLQTRALATMENDGYNSFEHWLGRAGLTIPPLWLSDLLTVKPHEEQLWFPPQNDIDVWLESDNDLLTELVPMDNDGHIIVGSAYSARSHNFTLSVRVMTALVSPPTASALMRALQTIKDSWDYKLPEAYDRFEIDTPPYKLTGWLCDTQQYLGLDERDPLRYGVDRIECEPSPQTAKVLNLAFAYDGQLKWIEAESKAAIFSYQTWGDNRGDEREEAFRYDQSVRSSGWRLRIDKKALKTFLNEMGFDLIVEIEITRKNKGYEHYSGYDEERGKETRSDHVILLRRDGAVESIVGRIGTWSTPSS